MHKTKLPKVPENHAASVTYFAKQLMRMSNQNLKVYLNFVHKLSEKTVTIRVQAIYLKVPKKMFKTTV